jgi:hypothetical protein
LAELEEATGIEGENFDRIYAGGTPTPSAPSGAGTPTRAPSIPSTPTSP